MILGSSPRARAPSGRHRNQSSWLGECLSSRKWIGASPPQAQVPLRADLTPMGGSFGLCTGCRMSHFVFMHKTTTQDLVGLFSVKEKSDGNEPVLMTFLLKTLEHWEILKQFPLFQFGNQRKQKLKSYHGVQLYCCGDIWMSPTGSSFRKEANKPKQPKNNRKKKKNPSP